MAQDLGILFDSKLTFNNHIDHLAVKANGMLGFTLRNCRGLSLQAVKSVYVGLVRSQLEYGSIVWALQYKVYKSFLERVQKKFLRLKILLGRKPNL